MVGRTCRAVLLVLGVSGGLVGCGSSAPMRQSHHQAASAARWPVGPLTSGGPVAIVASVPFARVTAVVTTDCQMTAYAVRYAIPCPTVLPQAMLPTEPEKGCRFAVVAPSNSSLCPAPSVHGWTFGSSDITGPGAGRPGFQHLVMTGSPRVEMRPSRAADGPTVHPEAIHLRARMVINGRAMRLYAVPMGNPSAFRGHLVLIWNEQGHTFVYGFHVVATDAMARALDIELVSHMRMIDPSTRR